MFWRQYGRDHRLFERSYPLRRNEASDWRCPLFEIPDKFRRQHDTGGASERCDSERDAGGKCKAID